MFFPGSVPISCPWNILKKRGRRNMNQKAGAAEKEGQETLSLSDAAARAGVQKEMPVQFANAEREFISQPGKPAEFPAAQEQQSREGKPASLGPADEKERNAWDDAIRRSLDFAREVEEKAELKREHADRAKEVSVRADTDIPIVYLEETGDRSDAERTPEKQPQASQPPQRGNTLAEDAGRHRVRASDATGYRVCADNGAGCKGSVPDIGGAGEKRIRTAGSYTEKQGIYRIGDGDIHLSAQMRTSPIVYLEETGGPF